MVLSFPLEREIAGGYHPGYSHGEDIDKLCKQDVWTFHIPAPSGSVQRGHVRLGEPPLWHEAEALLTWPPSPEGHEKPRPWALEMYPEETCGQPTLLQPWG